MSAWLLSALILFGQSVALVHASGHDVLATDEYCAQCLTQSIQDGKAVVALHTYTSLPAGTAPAVLADAGYQPHQTLTLHARSPPISPA